MWSVLGILCGILALFGIGVFIALFMGAGLGCSRQDRIGQPYNADYSRMKPSKRKNQPTA